MALDWYRRLRVPGIFDPGVHSVRDTLLAWVPQRPGAGLPGAHSVRDTLLAWVPQRPGAGLPGANVEGRSPDTLARYLLAAGASGLALLLALALSPLVAEMPFCLLLLAVVASAWYGGRGPALLSAALCGVALDYAFEDASTSLAFSAPSTILQIGTFLLVALTIGTLTGNLRALYRRVEAAGAAAGHAEQRLRHLVDGVDGVVWVADANSLRWTFVSRKVESLLGYPARCWLEEPAFWRTLIEPEDRAAIAACIAAGREGRPLDTEYRVVAADGRRVWLRHLMRPVGGDGARPRQVQGLLVDITARKEAAAREHFLADASRELGRSLEFTTTLQRVAELAAGPLADACIVEVLDDDGTARRVATATACSPQEALVREIPGRFLPDLSHPRDPLELVLATGRPVVTSDVSTGFLRGFARCPEPTPPLHNEGPVSALAVPLVARERTLGVYALLSWDPHRRFTPEDRALAEELAQRAALAIDNARLYELAQRASSVREEILASTSHELRTPIGHIKGFVSTLRQTDVVWGEADRQDFLAEIERETDRLSDLVGDLLDMSAIESGGLARGERAPERPCEIVRRGIERVRASLADRRLTVDVPEGLPDVLAYSGRLEQVLANLVENAAKYTPPGTPIAVSAAVVDDYLQVRVEDAGPGIPPEHLEHVFERFVRTAQSRAPGTGLGLAICRSIVEAHGGSIHAENRPAGGARFLIELPFQSAAGGAQAS